MIIELSLEEGCEILADMQQAANGGDEKRRSELEAHLRKRLSEAGY
jgi:hypothetical protein